MGQVRRRPEGSTAIEVALRTIGEQRRRIDDLERRLAAIRPLTATAPNGTRWRIKVGNDGTLDTEQL